MDFISFVSHAHGCLQKFMHVVHKIGMKSVSPLHYYYFFLMFVGPEVMIETIHLLFLE